MARAKIRPDYVSSYLITAKTFFTKNQEKNKDILNFFNNISLEERILIRDKYFNISDVKTKSNEFSPELDNIEDYFKDNYIKFNEECNRIVSKFTFGFDSFWKSRMDICKEYFERNQNLLDKYFQIIYDEVHKIGPLDVKENIEVCGLFGLGVNSRSGYDYIFLKEGHINCDINKFLQLIVHEYAGHSYHEENSNMEKVFGKFSYIADEGLAKVVSDKIVSLIPGIETIRCHNHDEPIEISYQVYENNWQKLDKGQSFEEWHKDCLLEIKEIYDSKEIDYFIYRGK